MKRGCSGGRFGASKNREGQREGTGAAELDYGDAAPAIRCCKGGNRVAIDKVVYHGAIPVEESPCVSSCERTDEPMSKH